VQSATGTNPHCQELRPPLILSMKSENPRNPVPEPPPSPDMERKGTAQEDLTGRDRLVSSVIFNWGGHFVFVIAGFIMPRMIDRRLGQELLGVWDFAWSIVSYFGLVQIGVASSVNRYVARYRMTGDISALNGIVSSASFAMTISGVLVLGLTIAVSLLIPQLFGVRLGENVREAQWVVFFLGTSMAIGVASGTYNGILTGCHQWRLRNIIESGWHAASISGMIIALLMGKGLWILSLVYLMGTALACATRISFAYRVCEGLRIHLSLVRLETIRKLLAFGGKTLVPSVSQMLLNQTTSILILAYLGPAALALYARPMALIRHTQIFVKGVAMTMTPTISSLHSTGNMEEIRTLVVTSIRYSFCLALPIVLVLVIFGGTIIELWMGPRYANALIPMILAAGFLARLGQTPILNVLAGMNAHGRLGIAEFITSLCSVGLIVIVLGSLRWKLAGVAVAVTLPVTLINTTYLPLLICRLVGLDTKRYFLSAVVGPVIHVLPFAVCLVVARIVFRTQPLAGLAWGGVTGSTILMVSYWKYAIPKSVRTKLIERLFYKTS